MIELTSQSGIGTLALDARHRAHNVLNAASISRLAQCVDEIERDPTLRGVVIVSRKSSFLAGGDLTSITEETDPQRIFAATLHLSVLFRRIELSPIPFVAAVRGAALGGGLELALACHHVVVEDADAPTLGLPEVKVGLMPGAGGTQRVPRLIGFGPAIPLLVDGIALSPREAHAQGLVGEVLAPAGDGALERAARAWIERQADADAWRKPWDKPGFAFPGGEAQTVANRRLFMETTARVHARTQGNAPAQRAILAAVYQGCQAGLDAALRIEARHFAECARSPAARAIISTDFFGRRTLDKRARALARGGPPIRRIAVIGSGPTGAGIAYAAGAKGMSVVLLDRTSELAQGGIERVADVARRAAARGDIADDMVAPIASRISVAEGMAGCGDCDLVIDAASEDGMQKGASLAAVEGAIQAGTVIATTASSITVGELARTLGSPGRLVGLHFCAPIESVPLLEVVAGEASSAFAVERGLAFAAELGKTPIVTGDVAGGFTRRMRAAYLTESLRLIADGCGAASIENGARRLGMPIGPLALLDEILPDVQSDMPLALWRLGSADAVIDRLIGLGRRGRDKGGGFYDHGSGGKRLWPGLVSEARLPGEVPAHDAIAGRLLYIQVIEAIRCLDDGAIASALEADVGAVLGLGFPRHLGGPCCFVDETGAATVVSRARELAGRHGERFEPPALLVGMAERGGRFRALRGELDGGASR
jgi:3-hydroxyacyl-CoA dehydrogenase/enoyl-CoA hydratase/3-hydroxybutyryl-CoA epimerase